MTNIKKLNRKAFFIWNIFGTPPIYDAGYRNYVKVNSEKLHISTKITPEDVVQFTSS